MLRTLCLLLIVALFSCQRGEDALLTVTPDANIETSALKAEISATNVHASVLESDWWQGMNANLQEVVAQELSGSERPLTITEIEAMRIQAVKTAPQEKVSGASPGYPSPNPEGDVVLNTQADVDAFGAQGYKNITGVLEIDDTGSADPICDLSALDKLKTIGSSLTIISDCITSLDGLDKLKSVGELGPFGFFAVNSSSLLDMSALNKLSTITGSINIIDCDELSNVTSAFSRITAVEAGQASVPLTSVYTININDNAKLADISGFGNVTNVEGGLRIINDDALVNLDGFSSLSSAGGNMFIFENASLEQINVLSVVTSLSGSLFVFDNPSLTQCCGLYNVLCSNPPSCTTSGVGVTTAIFNNGAGCTDLDIIAGGPCP